LIWRYAASKFLFSNRAKQKLIIIGSKTMMQEEPVLKALSDFMVER
jgi:superfamily I DNA and/or RNA helicase